MQKVYRIMKEAAGKPMLGQGGAMLGARVPPDIEADAEGNVSPGEHGMSVAPSLAALPMMLIPRRLRHLFPRAAGSNSYYVWRMGENAWAAGLLTPGLRLELDSLKPQEHGFIGPDILMPLTNYQAGLAATQDLWTLEETAVL